MTENKLLGELLLTKRFPPLLSYTKLQSLVISLTSNCNSKLIDFFLVLLISSDQNNKLFTSCLVFTQSAGNGGTTTKVQHIDEMSLYITSPFLSKAVSVVVTNKGVETIMDIVFAFNREYEALLLCYTIHHSKRVFTGAAVERSGNVMSLFASTALNNKTKTAINNYFIALHCRDKFNGNNKELVIFC